MGHEHATTHGDQAQDHANGTVPETRRETDSLGSRDVPTSAYWGIHTLRALENFPIANRPISVYSDLVVALAVVKQAAARANVEIGVLDPAKAKAIEQACEEIRAGALHDEFRVGVMQGVPERAPT
ncbi:hypothetical protein GCM10025867_23620 [Frondihabitans sucicola]|uniref:Fumarate lyase N-terminal domain-containing protein n=1 Tax=Frondihabitans sucicola TaxID=1268041 RepID=A0ABM8GNV3_9MICO|nr:hypothetical protein GCM10025867_23620 [Frondihabitans sucicola]